MWTGSQDLQRDPVKAPVKGTGAGIARKEIPKSPALKAAAKAAGKSAKAKGKGKTKIPEGVKDGLVKIIHKSEEWQAMSSAPGTEKDGLPPEDSDFGKPDEENLPF